MFGCILFAVAAVAVFIPVAFVRARRARGDAAAAAAGGDCDSDSAGGGGKASRATGGPAVGVEALEADGSGTMMVGRFSIDDDEGDMELTEEDGAAAPAVMPGIV